MNSERKTGQEPRGADLGALRIDESARSRGGSKWRWLALALGVLVVGSGLALAIKGKTAVVEVSAVRAAAANGQVALLNASGYVTPRRRATVAAKITGRVVEMIADEEIGRASCRERV